KHGSSERNSSRDNDARGDRARVAVEPLRIYAPDDLRRGADRRRRRDVRAVGRAARGQRCALRFVAWGRWLEAVAAAAAASGRTVVAQPLTVALPPDLRLWGGCTFSITALDPTTGADVTGVTISDVHIEVEQTAGST